VYYTGVKTSEFLRWLKSKGATFDSKRGKGSHIRVTLGDKQTVVPSHSKDLKRGTVEAIKKQLGLKKEEK
jgi:mRNA interferase HicA